MNRATDSSASAPQRSTISAPSITPASPPLPEISIILPAHNSALYLTAAIDSVLAQTFPRWELLIVDDGSIDSTHSIASQYATEHHDRIRILQHESHANRGVAASRNLAIQHARGNYLAFLDSDDMWHPEKLEKQYAFMTTKPDLAMSYTRSEIFRESSDDLFMPGLHEYGTELPADPIQAFLAIATGRAHFAFSSVMAKKEAVLAAGTFGTSLQFQNEDRILTAKIAATSPVALCPETLCRYRVHAGSYSSHAARQAMAPLLFLDVQIHVLRWAARQQPPPIWVREFTSQILSPETIPAFLKSCKNPSTRKTARSILSAFFFVSPLHAIRAFLRIASVATGIQKVTERERSSSELTEACRNVLHRIQQDGITQIVLYGAGQHTSRILQSGQLTACRIIAILDDHPKSATIMDIPVQHPSNFTIPDNTAIIISSDTLQTRLEQKARQHGLHPVYCLY